MTAPLAQQQAVSVKDPAAIRKRKRRAPAGGAADDCFTCSKRNVKCDRRRPYCSQCLDIGNECSGYKTQLTWGVGVASRGKLRGLSLPIAKAPPVAREPKRSPMPRMRSNSSIAAIGPHWSEREDVRHTMHRGPIDIPSISHHHASNPTTPYGATGYDYLSISHPEANHPYQHGSWNSIGYASSLVHSPVEHNKFSKFPLPIITQGLSSSVDTVSEVDYLSPMSQGYSREELPFGHSPNVMYDSYHGQQVSPITRSPPPTLVLDTSRINNSCPSLVYAPSEPNSGLHSHHSHIDPFEAHLMHHKAMQECDNLSVPEVNGFSTSCNTTNPAWAPSRAQEEDIQSPLSEHAANQWPLLREPRQVRLSHDLVAKMPFFMDYYKMTMAPAMVYIDGPYNPFRDHVMRLASSSQSLQHAICALSACNLRMKRKLSLGQGTRELYEKLLTEKQAMENLGDSLPQDPALAEEIQHRNLAVHLLNQQLNDRVKSSHDSVLATILILCHYRMAESGIAKFHTQFAGVKKILAMRKPQQFGGSSEDVAWMEALFVYFDAISASINDREAQLSAGADYNVSNELLPPGSENLVGCDRELFKTVSKLGRLNMLAQHRTVQDMAASSHTAGTTPRAQSVSGSYHGGVGGMDSLHHRSLSDAYVLPAQRFDGNGFAATLSDDELLASAMSSSSSYEDRRALFWAEWRDARQALQNWHFDATAVAANLPRSKVGHLRDLESLSEAFRYAAMLYTERLASPSTPSSHTNFQNLVSQVVYYATSLEPGSTAEKFLLWPLFVAGSECVNELQQNIVRSKCKDIMSRSGYMNNLAALNVLERLWAGDSRANSELELFGQQGLKSGSAARGPFNWAKCFGGPGAGVEWIMF